MNAVNSAPTRPPVTRCLTVWAAATVTLGALVWLVLPDLGVAIRTLGSPALATTPFDRLLGWLCAGVVALASAWLWTVTTVVALEAAGRRSLRVPGVPAGGRRLLLVACGAALAGGLAAPATATPGDLHQDSSGAASALLRGLPLPDRATGPGHGHRPVVVVRPGDTLWDLAGGSPRWHHVYQLNRDVIGPDPDLIRPGQRLRMPR